MASLSFCVGVWYKTWGPLTRAFPWVATNFFVTHMAERYWKAISPSLAITGDTNNGGREKSSDQPDLFNICTQKPWTEPQLNLRSRNWNETGSYWKNWGGAGRLQYHSTLSQSSSLLLLWQPEARTMSWRPGGVDLCSPIFLQVTPGLTRHFSSHLRDEYRGKVKKRDLNKHVQLYKIVF